MTLATMIADYIGVCCRKIPMSAVISILVGFVVLGLYTGFVGTIHVGSVVLGVVLHHAVRMTLCAVRDKEIEDDDERVR